MKRKLIIAFFASAAVLGVLGLFGHFTVIACSILLFQNTFIMIGGMRSGKPTTVSRESSNHRSKLAKKINILKLSRQVQSRLIRQLEAKNIELEKKIIDGEIRTEEAGADETVRLTGNNGFGRGF